MCKTNTFIIIISISIYFLNISCSVSNEHELTSYTVPSQSDDIINISDLSEWSKELQLETSENSLLSTVRDVKLYENHLFVADINKILIFDLEGKLVDKISNQGDGPGEYNGIVTFAIDPKSGYIYIASDSRILIYDKFFNFKKEVKLSHGTDYIHFSEGNLYMFLKTYRNKIEDGFTNEAFLRKASSDLEIEFTIPVKSVFLKEEMVGNYQYMHYISENKDGTFLYFPVLTRENLLRDTVYQIVEKGLQPVIKLNFEKKQVIDDDGFKELQILNILNSNSYLICEYDQERQRRLFIQNKVSGESFVAKNGILDSKKDPVILRPLDLKNDLFFYIKTAKFSNKSKEELNPIIGIVKLR